MATEPLPFGTIHIAGICEPTNPGGTGGWGYTIHNYKGDLLREDSGVVAPSPNITINVMAYVALCQALGGYLKAKFPGPVRVRSSSQLVIEQMRGTFRVRSGLYVPVYRQARDILTHFSAPVQWQWAPEQENTRAYELATTAVELLGVVPYHKRSL